MEVVVAHSCCYCHRGWAADAVADIVVAVAAVGQRRVPIHSLPRFDCWD